MLSTNLCNTFLAVWMHCASLEQIHLLDLYAGNFKAVYANAGSFCVGRQTSNVVCRFQAAGGTVTRYSRRLAAPF